MEQPGHRRLEGGIRPMSIKAEAMRPETRQRMQAWANRAISTGNLQDMSVEAERDRRAQEASDLCDQRFPRRYRDVVCDNEEILDWVREFHEREFEDCRSLMIMGPVGSGKTHQAYGAVRAAVSVPRTSRLGVAYRTSFMVSSWADLLQSMRPGLRGDDQEGTFRKYREVSLLFVDDLGLGKTSEFSEEAMYRLLDERYQARKPTIITTNLPMREFQTVVGDRIASRLAEMCERKATILRADDRRKVGV